MKKAKGFFAEFRAFASRGNVVDMAVGVIIGAAFKAIVDSLVNDIVMPFVGIFVDTSSFADVVLHIGGASIQVGSFLAAVVNFLIVALVIFCMVKLINAAHARMEALRKKEQAQEEAEEAAQPKGPTTEQLLEQILAQLQKQNPEQ